MTRSTLEATELSSVLLRLYRLSNELPITAFQDAALNLVREVLPFDSSMWGTATTTAQGIDIHTIHLHNQPWEMVEAYEAIKHLDTAAEVVHQQPRATFSFNANDWFHERSQAPLRDYGERFEQANCFISSDIDPGTQFAHWISLFRANDSARCTESENELLSLLAPHAMQALTLNRVAHLDQLEKAGTDGRGSAISDLRGVIYHADAEFEALLKTEWIHWRGGNRLPDDLLDSAQRAQHQHAGAAAVFSLRVEHGLLFLRARPRGRMDDLTPRERTVAELVARGQTHKEIAQMLNRSPSTVRNQIRSVYEKLGISNIAGLVDALRST